MTIAPEYKSAFDAYVEILTEKGIGMNALPAHMLDAADKWLRKHHPQATYEDRQQIKHAAIITLLSALIASICEEDDAELAPMRAAALVSSAAITLTRMLEITLNKKGKNKGRVLDTFVSALIELDVQTNEQFLREASRPVDEVMAKWERRDGK